MAFRRTSEGRAGGVGGRGAFFCKERPARAPRRAGVCQAVINRPSHQSPGRSTASLLASPPRPLPPLPQSSRSAESLRDLFRDPRDSLRVPAHSSWIGSASLNGISSSDP